MSESLKPRFAVDLTEIERQLAQAHVAAPAQQASPGRGDPLAELARIVGQDDPFQSLLANDDSRSRTKAVAADDLFTVRDNVAQGGGYRHAETPVDLDYYPQGAAAPSQGYQQVPASQAHAGYSNEAYDQGYYDDGQERQDAGAYGQHLDYPPVEQRRSRKGMMAIGAVVGATVLGLGGAYLLGGGSIKSAGGQPPLVTASNEPTKVQPQNPGGVEIPNQNKQIYERANHSTETKVVNREEQPVDVKQAVRMNSGAVADATGATTAAQPANALNLGEPRKVRTVAIRPDGTVAQPQASAAAPARSGPVPVPAMTLPPAAQPAAAAPASTTPGAAQPKAAASTPAAAPATPAPKAVAAASTPTSGSSPQKVASAQPVPLAPAATEASTGGYAVQLGLANSETAAESALAGYQRKYPDLGSVPSLIRKAEVNGNTIYRVRVGPLSKEEASSLCSKLQGQGGQCFVAKN